MSIYFHILLARVSILVVFAYAAGRVPPFRRVLRQPTCKEDWVFRAIYFVALAVIEATITPRNISDFQAPVAAIIAAGLIAGPATGVITGIAGLCSISLWDGQLSTGLAMVLIGYVAGIAGMLRPALAENAFAGMFAGALGQVTWASFAVLLMSATGELRHLTPYNIFPALMNALQVGMFLAIVSDIRAIQQRVDRAELLRALEIARSSLGQGKSGGLDEDAAANIVALVRSATGISSVEVYAEDHLLASTKTYVPASVERVESALVYAGRQVGRVVLCDTTRRRIDPQLAQLGIELSMFTAEYHLRLRELREQAEAVSRTELKALQAQVHPHFFFNALNTLAALCQIDPKQANRLTVKLGEFLRSSLQATSQNVVSLERELAVVRAYLEIEQARFQDGLKVEEHIDTDTEDVYVPPFALQTLVENAVIHGIANRVSPGHLTITTRMRGNRLVCAVIDDGEPASGNTPGQNRPGPHGLEILEARLRNLYGDGAGLHLRKRRSGGMIALMWIETGRLDV